MIAWQLIVLAVLTIAARALPRIVRPYAISSDAYYHLLAADRIRANGHRLPRRLRGLNFPGPYDYPPLLHVLLSFFPRRWMPVVECAVSPIIDAVYMVVSYGFIDVVLQRFGGMAPAAAQTRAFLVSLLFMTSPALLYTGRGPRAYNANPRILAEVLFSIAMIGAFWWYVDQAAAGAVAMVVVLGALLLASKFGAQVVVFVVPVIAIELRDWSLGLLACLGFAAALVPFRGHYLRIAKGHLGHMALFGTLGRMRETGMARPSEWGEFWRLVVSPFRPGAIYRLIALNGISTFLVRNPQLVLLAAAIPFATAWQAAPARFLVAWIAATMVVFLVITMRPLLFLGEPERYVSYSVLAQFAVLALYWQQIPVAWLAVLALYNVAASGAYMAAFVYLNFKDPDRRNQGAELKKFFASERRVRNILPIAEGPYSLAYTTDQNVFYPCGNFQIWETPVAEYLRIYEAFLTPRVETFDETVARYGIDTVLVNKRNLVGALRLKLDACPRIFQNDTFLVLDVAANRSQADAPLVAKAACS